MFTPPAGDTAMTRSGPFWTALLVTVGLFAGCGSPVEAVSEDAPAPDDAATPWPVTPFPELPPEMNDVPKERIELGRSLFYDPVISVDDQTACATCDSEIWGMGDGSARAVGHGAGLGVGPRREGPNTLRRNSPALYNLAFRSSLLWDGRAETLEEQAMIPITSDEELGLGEASVVDRGLEEQTGLETDRNKFRTPTLRNLEATEPYFHNGSIKEVSTAIRHEIEHSGMPFTEEDVRLIRLFVHNTLRDESKNPVRPKGHPMGGNTPEAFAFGWCRRQAPG